MKIHLLSGFLGSGKTTAIHTACQALAKEHIKTAVITNDQGSKLVDSGFLSRSGVPGKQVINGCFCCHYSDLDRQITSLIEAAAPDIIFAESVGSCTDIVATVMKPLLRHRPGATVTISAFADIQLLQKLIAGEASFFEENIRYIYFKQLEEAGTIVVSKSDLAREEEVREVRQRMEERYPGKTLLFQNSLSPESIGAWLRMLNEEDHAALPSLDIDYDLYGQGEASLAWLDQELELFSSSGHAVQTAVELAKAVHREIRLREYPIGHLKFLLDGKTKISYTALSQPEITEEPAVNSSRLTTLLINARVQTTPLLLSSLVGDCIRKAESLSGCTIRVCSASSFQPGYPRPEHRFRD